MELKRFISETINEIIDGVLLSQEYANNHDAKVNPQNVWFGLTKCCKIVDKSTGSLIQEIEFDISISVIEDEKSKSIVGILVGPIGFGQHDNT